MIYDFSDGDFIFPMSDNMGISSDGELRMRMGDNLSLNLDDGDIHFTSPWDKNDDSDDNDFPR